jgi:cytochrome c553
MKYILILVLLVFMGCSSKPVDGKSLYSENCANCHGKMARKSAFGKSAVIGGFTEQEIIHAIKGYQEGTYGGSMKSMMKSEVSSLNEAEINALAKYIAELY